MYRILIKCGQEMISATRLTSRILGRAGHPIEIIQQPDPEKTHEEDFSRFDWEEPVVIKQQVLANWEFWSSEEIIERLDYLRSIRKADVAKSDLDQTLDLWLLRAMAQEKSLYPDVNEIEETYHHCRHLGKWNAVLVRNNLAVLKAKRKECLESLKLLAEAISLSLTNHINSKAPFYNAALVFQQLHQANLLFDPRYLDLLDRIASMIGSPSDRPANGDGDNSERSDAEQDNRVFKPAAAYRRIAAHGYSLEEPESPDLFHRNISYLTPDFDLFESFGDFPDNVDSRTAHDFLEKGIALVDDERFNEGIRNFELAREFDPAFSSESDLRVEQVSDQWRQSENRRLSNYLNSGDYDNATNVILTLDKRLKRENDEAIVLSINKLKHLAVVREADSLSDAGDAESSAAANIRYLGLLKQDDLGDSLRLYVSNRLVGNLNDNPDNSERHQRLNELIANNAHPDVINRFSDQLVRELIQEAHVQSHAGHYEMAIQEFFWAILLPNQTKRRDELFQSALFALGHLLKTNRKLSDCESLKDPIFSELTIELTERWNAEQDKEASARFARLDSEPLILKKQIDELLALLDQLTERAPTTDRLVDKLRLPREREAQKLFGSIQEQLNLISQEGDHSKRREKINGDLRRLHKLAADFAGGNRSNYAKQITELVSKAEEYLLAADQRQFMNDLYLEISNRNEKEFIELREVLKADAGELKVLDTFGATLRQMQDTAFFAQIQELAEHWFETQGKARYRALTASDENRAREVLRASRASLQKYQKVLPKEFKANLSSFLEELLAELDSPAQLEPEPASESPQMESSPPPPPTPSEPRSSGTGLFRTIVEWVKSVFESERQA